MFDAYEAVDNIIDEINENYNESCYEDIYDELCERVECGLLSVADAELINEAAYEKYMMEDKSDIQLQYDRRDAEQRWRSAHGYAKRPRITNNMSDSDKLNLRQYDHGAIEDSIGGHVRSMRGAGAARDNYRDEAYFKRGLDARIIPQSRKTMQGIKARDRWVPLANSGITKRKKN